MNCRSLFVQGLEAEQILDDERRRRALTNGAGLRRHEHQVGFVAVPDRLNDGVSLSTLYFVRRCWVELRIGGSRFSDAASGIPARRADMPLPPFARRRWSICSLKRGADGPTAQDHPHLSGYRFLPAVRPVAVSRLPHREPVVGVAFLRKAFATLQRRGWFRQCSWPRPFRVPAHRDRLPRQCQPARTAHSAGHRSEPLPSGVALRFR